MKKITILIILFSNLIAFSQQSLSLEECYQLVKANYPLAKQNELFEKQNELDLEIINTGKLPQIDLSAYVTYQSDVVTLLDPTLEPLNKDHYRALITVNQLIYGGGVIDATSAIKSANLKTQQKQVEVNLYQLKKQVNQLYFSILLVQKQQGLLSSKKKQLEANLKEVKSGINNGTILPTSDKILEVELLKINQQSSELSLNRISLIETLSSLIGSEISRTIHFQNPTVLNPLDSEVNRPELELFQLKKEEIETSEQLLSKQNLPKVFGFVNGGYGSPGLDFLDNSFETFYTVGVQLNWKVFDWNANKKKREVLAINKDFVDTEREVFELNTTIQLNQQELEIEKLSTFIKSDLEIIHLREAVLKSAESQLNNGIITSSAYITELTNLYEDENNLSIHKIELLLAKANYNITKGQ